LLILNGIYLMNIYFSNRRKYTTYINLNRTTDIIIQTLFFLFTVERRLSARQLSGPSIIRTTKFLSTNLFLV
jgi:hypothetical protein